MIEWITYDEKWKTLCQKEKLHVLCNFFFCHYVFKKLSAAEASESVRVKAHLQQRTFENIVAKDFCFCFYTVSGITWQQFMGKQISTRLENVPCQRELHHDLHITTMD